MYGGNLTLTHSHLYHYWHFPTMVGFCHGGNVILCQLSLKSWDLVWKAWGKLWSWESIVIMIVMMWEQPVLELDLSERSLERSEFLTSFHLQFCHNTGITWVFYTLFTCSLVTILALHELFTSFSPAAAGAQYQSFHPLASFDWLFLSPADLVWLSFLSPANRPSFYIFPTCRCLTSNGRCQDGGFDECLWCWTNIDQTSTRPGEKVVVDHYITGLFLSFFTFPLISVTSISAPLSSVTSAETHCWQNRDDNQCNPVFIKPIWK